MKKFYRIFAKLGYSRKVSKLLGEMIWAKNLINLFTQVIHNDYYQIDLINNINKTEKMDHTSCTSESIRSQIKVTDALTSGKEIPYI